jgi:uncharacterized repeat protein (TIGR01451 family)
LLLCCAVMTLGFASTASATVTAITTQADGNMAGTLRYAITSASSGDTVNVPAGTYSLTLGALVAPMGVTIAGAGASSTTINGNDASRILYSAGPLTVSGITFTHGKVASSGGNNGGGAITVQGTGALTVSNSAFTSDSAAVSNSDFSGGGAIYVMGGASATVSGSTFSGDTVTADLLDHNGGGAIFVGGGSTLSLSADTFSGDSFTQTNAANMGMDGGGAVFGSGATTISGSTFSGDSASITAAGTVSTTGGGAVFSGGGTTVTASTFAGDTATIKFGASGNGGGALYNSGGALSITGSTFASDRAVLNLVAMLSNGGGAVYNAGTTTTMLNTTLSANSVSASGGGPTAGGGALYDNGMGGGTISSSTIDGNSVSFPGLTAYGGGIFEVGTGGTLALHNTIIAGNAVAGGTPVGTNCYALGGVGVTTISSTGHNIEDANTCGLTGPGDQPNTNPLLGPLQDNGGPTFTQALLPGSPAINRGDNTGCPAADERGVTRPQGGTCDIGAYEVGVADLALTASGSPNPVVVGGHLTYTAKVTNGGPTPTNATLHVTLPAGVGFVSAPAGCVHSGSAVSCALGALAAHGTAQVAIVASPTAPGSVVSTLSVSSSDPDPTPADNSTTVTVAALTTPTVTAFKESAKKWHLKSKNKRKVGTTFSFKLNESARVTLPFTQSASGRKVGKKCVAPTKHNKSKRKCTRQLARGSLSLAAHAGTNKVSFVGRPGHSKKLKPGSYTVTITAVDALGERSRPHSLSFTILK